MEPLKFKHGVFHSGLNVTVRSGIKWFNYFTKNNTKPFDVDITTADDRFLHKAVIEAVFTAESLLFIPDQFLRLEHNANCQEINGLYRAMKDVYPDFNLATTVSVVVFSLKE